MALLHATVHAARALGLRVVALHVHHGLSPNADAWQRFVEQRCARWAADGLDVGFAAARIAGKPTRGVSVEAWARERRYEALVRLAREHAAGLVLLAHHRRDQAETVLLQALRGAGVAGLAGMAPLSRRDTVVFARPWLERAPTEIAAYVRAHRLRHVVDESNDDRRYDRNRLRHEVWPALEAAFAHAEAALALAARSAQAAQLALQEMAAHDLALTAPAGPLEIERWALLPTARAVEALRAWLRHATGRAPTAALLRRLVRELPHARSGRWAFDGGELRLYRRSLRFARGATAPARGEDARPSATHSAPETALSIDAPGVYALPGWGGALAVESAPDDGVPLDAVRRVTLARRRGGERWQAGAGRPARSLKKQWQAAGVPAWEREGPLVYADDRLLYVPGLGVDARLRAPPGSAQVRLRWIAAGRADTAG
jgi:tRNA(Ile)-lysidine synthase